MPLITSSTITVTQQPAPVTYKNENSAIVLNVNSGDPLNKFTRVDFNIDGVIFRKPVINNLSFIDTNFVTENKNINEVDVNTYIFTEIHTVNKVTVSARAYTDSNDFSALITVDFFKLNIPSSFPHGIDTARRLNVYEGQQVLFLPSIIKTVAIPAMEEISFDYYRDGVVVNTVNLQNNYPFPNYFFYSNILVYKENIFKGLNSIRAVCRATATPSKVFSDTGEVLVKVATACENYTNLSVLYLNRFNRWTSFPFLNVKKLSSSVQTDTYKLNPNFFDYSQSAFINNARDYIAKKEVENFIEVETGYLTDDEYNEMRYIIESPLHGILINSNLYYAQIVDKNFVDNEISLNGLKNFKLKLKVQNVDF